MATINGTDGDDTLLGTSGADVISGLIGNDRLFGFDGDDILSGGEGDDYIDPGSGKDQVDGGAGNDTIRLSSISSGFPDSTLDGGTGLDTLDFSIAGSFLFFNSVSGQTNTLTVADNLVTGVERFIGGLGPDIFSFAHFDRSVEAVGGGGADSFFSGGAAPAIFRGGDGNDNFTVDPEDSVYGDAGDDSFFISGKFGGSIVQGIVDGGTGFDLVKLNIQFAVDLAAATAVSGVANYAISSIEAIQAAAISGYRTSVLGSNSNETFSINPLFNDGSVGVLFDGRGGDDTLTGSMGSDELFGGSGNDFIDGRSGIDRLTGGTGDDSFFVDRQADLIFEDAGAGYDSVTATTSFYLYANIEALSLLSDAGDLFGVGNDLANRIVGNEGSNLLIAGAGDDDIAAGSGVDSVFGEDGNDLLHGNAGIDYLVGGTGNDALFGDAGADALYGEAGDDTLVGGASFDTDILVGGDGDDQLDGASGLGDYDLIDGGAGNDLYRVDTPADLTFEAAGGGIDTVVANIVGAGYYLYANTENLILEGITPFGVGNELANVLTGNAVGNYLLGGAGNDILNGKAGNDVLFGEGGADLFAFDRGTGGDVVGDFAPGIDRILLTGFGLTSFAAVQALFVENGGNTGIVLGSGELVVLNGVANAQLTAADFLFG